MMASRSTRWGVVPAVALVLAINGTVNLVERWALGLRPAEREMKF
jgi:hypothetical protein